MKNMKKLLLTVVVAIVAVVCFAFSASALAEKGQCGDNAYWEYDSANKELVISGSGAIYNNYGEYNSNIESVVIKSGITSIGDDAFTNCTSLANITIPDSVTSIGEFAFYNCTSLASITIPDSVTEIGENAFSNCNSLKNVVIPDNVTFIGEYAFAYCKGITNVIIGDGVVMIGASAFSQCSNLMSVTVGKRVVEIDGYAFYSCDRLIDVYYCNTQAQWKKMWLGQGNTDLTDAIIHYNYCTHKNKTSYKEKAPTCDENGYTAGEYCNDCEMWISGHSEIKAIGHSFTEKIPDLKHLHTVATNESAAVYKYDCANCDAISPDQFYSYGEPLSLGVTASITAVQNTSAIKLTWAKAEKATGYRIYYKLAGDISWRTSVPYTTATTITYSKLPAGQSYRFAIRSVYKEVDGTYILGGYKEIATATKAAAPADVYSFQNSSAIRLIWTASKGATGYRIYYKSGNVWKVCVSTTASTTHTFKNLKAGSKNTFAVRPYIIVGGAVIWSDYITITTATRTISPVVTLTSPSKGKLNLSWNAVNGAEAYQVYYKIGNGNYKLYKTYTGVQSLRFSNLKSGTKYTFAVRGVIKGSEEYIYGFHNPVTVSVK